MKAAIFLNGEFETDQRIIQSIEKADLIVAVDGGVHHVQKLGLTADLIIGDLDSADPQVVSGMKADGAKVIRYPVEKDETDFEIALNYLKGIGVDEISVLAASGGREDHFLGNIHLISNPKFHDMDIRLLVPGGEILICKKRQLIKGKKDDLVSLIPLSNMVKGVTTEGLFYPLKNDTLLRWKARGISNLLMKEEAFVQHQSGVLLCIHLFAKAAKFQKEEE